MPGRERLGRSPDGLEARNRTVLLGNGGRGVQGATFGAPILPPTCSEACVPVSLGFSG